MAGNMSRPLWVDPENLRARGAAFREIGDEVPQVTERLNDVLSQEGRWWGDDESGIAFERSYQPDAERVTAALRALSDALHGFGGQIAEAVGNLETADQAGATHIKEHGELIPRTPRPPTASRPGPDPKPAGLRPVAEPDPGTIYRGTQPAAPEAGDLPPWSESGNPPARPLPAAGADRPRPGKFDRADKSAQDRRRTERAHNRVGSRGPAAESMLMRRALALAKRHSVEVSGFDATDLDEEAAVQFLDATDDVLTHYLVISVSRVRIGRAGESSVVRIARHAGEDGTPTWSVILDGGLLSRPDPLTDVARLQRKPSEDYERPLYAATVREFGRAFDLAGDHRARHRAQRALIAEYLRGTEGFRAADLARLVAGYKRWRDQLSDGSFDQGRFGAAAALVEGFTEVVLKQDSASEPSKTLCRLLVEHAGGHERAGEVAGNH